MTARPFAKFFQKAPGIFELFAQLYGAYMPTLPDYPGVLRIRHQSPGLPYGSLYLPNKIIF